MYTSAYWILCFLIFFLHVNMLLSYTWYCAIFYFFNLNIKIRTQLVYLFLMIKPTRFHQTFTGKLCRHYEKCKHLTVITVAFINAHVLVSQSYNKNIPYSLFCFCFVALLFLFMYMYIYMFIWPEIKLARIESEHRWKVVILKLSFSGYFKSLSKNTSFLYIW